MAATNDSLKPIFHCEAKYLASGVGVGQCPQHNNFALGIPTCWYLAANANPGVGSKTLASGVICVTPDANPRRQSVEYRWRWASGVGAGVGHVHFMFFVLISFAFCSQRKPSFRIPLEMFDKIKIRTYVKCIIHGLLPIEFR